MKIPSEAATPAIIHYSAQSGNACLPELLDALQQALAGDHYWETQLQRVRQQSGATIHIGVFIEPYLQFILEGKKTLESRFSVNRTAPYCQVRDGDILLLKRSGGPIVGICCITHAWFHVLDPKTWNSLQSQYAQALCISDPAFWQEKQKANYASLMQVRHVRPITPTISFVKSDRRGWLALTQPEIPARCL
jgi:hypothetical protein